MSIFTNILEVEEAKSRSKEISNPTTRASSPKQGVNTTEYRISMMIVKVMMVNMGSMVGMVETTMIDDGLTSKEWRGRGR